MKIYFKNCQLILFRHGRQRRCRYKSERTKPTKNSFDMQCNLLKVVYAGDDGIFEYEKFDIEVESIIRF